MECMGTVARPTSFSDSGTVFHFIRSNGEEWCRSAAALPSRYSHRFASNVSHGQFPLPLSERRVGQLLGCVEHFSKTNDLDAAGDALLLLAGGIATTSSPSLLDVNTCDGIRLRLTSLLQASHRSPQRWRCIVLRAACQVLESKLPNSDDKSFLQALLVAICPPVNHTIPSVCDPDNSHIAHATDPPNFTKWPEYHNLALSPLAEIQHIVLRALRALPPPNFDDPTEYTPYWRAFISVIGAGKYPTVHLSALHAACRARQALATITAAKVNQPSPEKLLSELSTALLAAVMDGDSKPSQADLATEKEGLDVYLHLIFTLAKNSTWRHRLIEDGHVRTCIALIDIYKSRPFSFYLPAFFLRIAPQSDASPCCATITNEQWWLLMWMAWYAISQCGADVFEDGTEILPALARRTKMYMPAKLSKENLGILDRWLEDALDKLRLQNPTNDNSAVEDLKCMVHCRWQDVKPQSNVVLRICPRFRILVIGKTGIGKSSLINSVFGIQDAFMSNDQRGDANIDTEYISEQNDRFILHDSGGFEPGEEYSVRTVREFIQRRRHMKAFGDRLHAVWLCLEIPRIGGRLLETGTEDFLQLKCDGELGEIPVVVVFTKYDKFIDRVERTLNDSDLCGLSKDALNDLVEQRADAKLHDICAQPLKKFARSDIPYAAVSTKDRHKGMSKHLIQITEERIRQHIPNVMASIAQRDLKLKIKTSIDVGKRRYWKALVSTMFRGRTTWACLEVLHTNIVRVWDFRDQHRVRVMGVWLL
ncbi:hypothetical protein K503DRAFT_600069 [Rhizopogon vinicolor AM-OR11-026]|uniref:G domain-containing protein n=1 Tax=Rhizopogon vinicolor AM-OR11-026 TaxID=1314800 RepID=A0A1B7MIV2_9AGAM|nr:hypothetical protein K503DRAFT_600069 [Rhizopogon vinicolor AM-OR11-026]